MNNVATPAARGPVPRFWVLRLAQVGGVLLALWGVLLATGVVHLVPKSELPDSSWDISGAAGLRWSDGSMVSDRVMFVGLLAFTVPVFALFVGSLYVHHWFLPERSTGSFAVVGVLCVGGLTVPWMFGHAAWPDRRIRFLPLIAALVATVFSGSLGPIRVNHDVWAWWREALVGGTTAIGAVATAVAIERILRALR